MVEDAINWIGIVRLCREFSTLPETGGLFHQNTLHISKMERVLDAEAYVVGLQERTTGSKAKAQERLKERLGA